MSAVRRVKPGRKPNHSVAKLVKPVETDEKPKGYRRIGRKLVKLSDAQVEVIERNAFKPGCAPGPGRPKSLAEQIRLLTNDGEFLVKKMWEIANSPYAKTSDVKDAVEWLSDRGFGKAVQQIVVTPTDPIRNVDFTLVPHEQLDVLRSTLKLIEGPDQAASGDGGRGGVPPTAP